MCGMKREAVQEERQRGAKMLPKQTEELSQTNPVRDLTIERLMEAEQRSESRSGDNAIPYLKVGSSSVVPTEYKVHGNVSALTVCRWLGLCAFVHIFLSLYDFGDRVPYRICVKW